MKTYVFTWLLSLFDFPVIKTGPNRITPRKVFHFRYWTNEKKYFTDFSKSSRKFRVTKNSKFSIQNFNSLLSPKFDPDKFLENSSDGRFQTFVVWHRPISGFLIRANYPRSMSFPEMGLGYVIWNFEINLDEFSRKRSASPTQLEFWKNIWMGFPGFANKGWSYLDCDDSFLINFIVMSDQFWISWSNDTTCEVTWCSIFGHSKFTWGIGPSRFFFKFQNQM